MKTSEAAMVRTIAPKEAVDILVSGNPGIHVKTLGDGLAGRKTVVTIASTCRLRWSARKL